MKTADDILEAIAASPFHMEALRSARELDLPGWYIGAGFVRNLGWDRLHDEGTEGSHHARVARVVTEHGVQAVVAAHMGDPMVRMLEKLGLAVHLGASGDARKAVQALIGGRMGA